MIDSPCRRTQLSAQCLLHGFRAAQRDGQKCAVPVGVNVNDSEFERINGFDKLNTPLPDLCQRWESTDLFVGE
jgi:hypothetical protein